jgi:hypothetical protein
MRRTIIIIPALAVALSASIAPASASETAAATASQTSQPRARADQDPNRRVCVSERMSTSRIPRRVCRTAREWAEEEQAATPLLPIR